MYPRFTAWAAPAALVLALTAPAHAGAPKAGPPASQDDLFGLTKVWKVHLRLTAEAWEKMQPKGGPKFGPPGFGKPAPKGAPADPNVKRSAFGMEFPYVRGTLEFEKHTLQDVGVRFKGNSTYMSSAGGLKRPFKIDLNRYVEGQKFLGLTMVALGNNAFDPSQLREALSYAVFREAGVPAPRTAFVKLYVTVEGKHDREYAGLYTLIEAVNKPFLKRHFQDARGLLLKPEMIQGLPYFGEDWSRYEDRYRPKTTATPEAKKRLIAFTKLVNNAPEATFRKEIASYLDVDRFLRYLAANTLLVNLDSFPGLGHNYYLYLDPKTNRFTMMPWDLNMSLGGMGMFGGDKQTELSIRKPYMGNNRLIERLLAVKEHDSTYREHLRKLTATVFRPEKLNAEVAAMRRAVGQAIAQESKKAMGPGKGGFPMMPMMAPDLGPFIKKRVESVVAQLDGKSQGVEPAFGPFGGPKGPKGKFGPPKGFGPGMFLAKPLFQAADTDKDGKVSQEEFKAFAARLFQQADPKKTGTIDEKALGEALNKLLPPPPGFGPPPGPGGPKPPPPGFGPPPGSPPGAKAGPFPVMSGPGTMLAKGLLKQAGAKEGKVSAAEFAAAAERLFREGDRDRSKTLDENELAETINRVFPPPVFLGEGPGAFPPRAGEGLLPRQGPRQEEKQ